MPTNQEYYGLESEWVQPNAANIVGTNRTNQWLTAYFGPGYNIGSVVYNAGSLASGLHNNKIPKGQQLTDGYMIDEPIDNSLSYCGLGNESVYSNIAYLEYKTGMCSNSFTAEEDRSVTNFAFCQTQGSDAGFYIYNDSSSNNINGSRSRWSPYGINGNETSISRANRNRPVTPYAQIPVRNTVFYPVLRVASSIQENPKSVSGMSITNVDWEDYMNLQNSVNYTTHPYILRISMSAYTSRYVDDIDPVTGVPENDRFAMGNSYLSGVAVLSPSNVADGEPMDIANPTQNLTEIYSYYNTRSKHATNSGGVMLFGYSAVGSNDNDYINEPAPSPNPVNASAQRLVFFPHPDAILREAANNTNTSASGWYYLEYYDDLVDWVMEQMACFGLFFTLDKATAARGALNSPLMFLGTLENGIGHGHWTSGEENEDQPQWEWDTTNRSSYKPSEGGGGGDDPYGDANHYLAAHAYARGGKVYGTDDAGKWINLLNDINSIDIHADGFNDSVFFGQEPLDCLIEGKLVFVNGLLGAVNVSHDVNIELGQHQTSVTATRIRSSYPYTADYGSITIDGVYNDFRDFEPYTSINLLLPFAGSVELPPSVAMYHDVHLYETIDLLTGDLFYTIHIDNIEFGRAYGNCALEMSKNGYAVSQYAQMRYSLHEQSRRSYFNAAASLVGGISGATIAGSPQYGNVAGVVSQATGGLINGLNSFLDGFSTGMYNRHTAPPVASSDKVSSCVEYGRCIVPAIVVTSPRMIKDYTDANYKVQTGFATYKVGRIGDESGPIVCDSVNPSGLTCSAEEKRMIIEHLKRGIYRKPE